MRARLDRDPAAMRLRSRRRSAGRARRRTSRIAEPDRWHRRRRPVEEPDPRRPVRLDRPPATAMMFGGVSKITGAVDGLAAPPQPDRPRIAGSRRHALAIGARQQQRIAVEPVTPPLASGSENPSATKLRRSRSNSRRVDGVAAAARQAQDRPVVAPGSRGDPARASPRLRSLASASMSSRISHAGCGLAELLQRGSPPQAARVGGILPEIV